MTVQLLYCTYTHHSYLQYNPQSIDILQVVYSSPPQRLYVISGEN